jgi:hypothetical protein
MLLCWTGPREDAPVLEGCCACSDFDEDGDADLTDFACLQNGCHLEEGG